MIKKVETHHTLEEYTRKYGKIYDTGKLLSFSENEVKGYDNKYDELFKSTGHRINLMNKKRVYWKIDKTYYPIPTFFEKIGLGFLAAKPLTKTLICAGVAVILAGAIATPLILLSRNSKFVVTLDSDNTLEFTNKYAQANKDYNTDILLLGDNDNYPDDIVVKSVNKNKEEVTLTANSDYYYINKGNNASLKINGNCITSKVTVTAKGTNCGFKNTPWKTINKILDNGGVTALKKHFKVKSLVGKEHFIDLDNDRKTTVMVIGERQDSIYNSGYKKCASLTFAFNKLEDIANEVNTTYLDLGFGSEYSYVNSNLDNACRNLLNKISDSSLKDNIKHVNKSTAWAESGKETAGNYDIYDRQMFALSLKELGGYNYTTELDDGNEVRTLINREGHELSIDCENNCYTYFNHLFERENERYYENLVKFGVTDIWTRTPAFRYSNSNAYSFNTGDYKFKNTSVAETKYFIPAFAIGEETSFESDSWDNVISYANEGFDRLKEVYGLDTFIGQERKMLIDNTPYRVRVIGENHDQISGTQNNMAALTFEFTRPVDGVKGSLAYSGAVTSTEANWKSSNAREVLNDSSKSTSFINRMPNEVKNNLKTVDKYSAKYYSSDQHAIPGVVKTEDKIFALSRKEIGAKNALAKVIADESECIELSRDPYTVEGDTYAYYTNEYSKLRDNDYANAINARIKGFSYDSPTSTESTKNQSYFLRSADPTNIDYSQSVKSDGDINYGWSTESYAICPCFCIGESGNYVAFENDTWSNVINNINKGEETLVNTYGIQLKDFVGKQRYINVTKDGNVEQYRVRVVGVNHDALASDSSKKALMTFEFTRCIDNAVSFSKEGENHWSSSTLRNKCNNDYINYLPSEVKNAIKPVVKNTFRADTLQGEKTIDKLFCLSAVEMGGSVDPLYDKYDGTVYQHYDNFASSQTILNAERIKGGSLLENYHLRTPSISSEYVNLVYFVTQDGTLSNYLPPYSEMGVAPAFAI